MTEDARILWLEFDGLHLCVRSPDGSHLQWLEEFLSPHFRSGACSPDCVEVELVLDAALFEACGRDHRPVSTLPAFAFDSEVVQLPLLSADQGGPILFDDHLGVFYALSRDHRRATILAERNKSAVRSALMRVCREYAMNHSHALGDFFLHASCFLHGEMPLVVTGPKAAGKTTLLAFACLHGGCGYLANDRVLVRKRGSRHVLKGMPSIVSLRAGTREFFPEIDRPIREEGLYFRLNSSEGQDDCPREDREEHGGKCMLSPPQFVRVLGTRHVAEAQDPVVIFPVITGREGTFAIRRIATEEALERLRNSLFGARHWVTSTPVFNLRGGLERSDHGRREQKCREFSDRLGCLELEIGTNLYDRAQYAKDLVAALSAEGKQRP